MIQRSGLSLANVAATKSSASLPLLRIRFAFGSDKNNGGSSNKNYLNTSPEEGQRRIQEIMKNYQNSDVKRTTIDEQLIRDKLLKRETKLPMTNYEISKDGEYYNAKSNNNPTKDVFNFSEDFLKKKNVTSQVYGLGNGYFSVNSVWYPGSLMIFPSQVFLWDVQTAADIRAHSLDLLDFIKPSPNYIIIGTGKEKFFLEESIYERFTKQKIRVDILPTFEACSSFNVCAEDGFNVCALPIPANL